MEVVVVRMAKYFGLLINELLLIVISGHSTRSTATSSIDLRVVRIIHNCVWNDISLLKVNLEQLIVHLNVLLVTLSVP